MISIHHKGAHSEATANLVNTTVSIVAAELKTTESEAIQLIAGLVDRLTETVGEMVNIAFKPKRSEFMAEIESRKARLFKNWIGESRGKVEGVWNKREDLLTLAIALHRQDLFNRLAVAEYVERQTA